MKRKWMAVTLVFTLLLSTFSVTYVKPRKADAIVQALVPIAGALVAEVALDLGWKYVVEPAYEAIVKKVAGEVVSKPDLYDFPKNKPKKGNGKIEVDVSPNDRAKIAKKLADEAKKVIDLDTARRAKTSKPVYKIDVADTADPFYGTSIELDVKPKDSSSMAVMEAYEFFISFFRIEFQAKSFEQRSDIGVYSDVTGNKLFEWSLAGGPSSNPKKYDLVIDYYFYSGDQFMPYLAGIQLQNFNMEKTVEGKLWKAYKQALNNSVGKKVYYSQGLVVPDSAKDVYSVDERTPPTYQLPNHNDLSKRLVLDMPDNVPYFEGEIVDVDYEDLDNYIQHIEDSYNTYIEYGDVVTTNNYETITNNYYTTYNYEKSDDEVKQEISIIIENENNVGGVGCPEGDELCKSAEPYDRTILTYIKETYDYLDDWIDQLVASSRNVKESAGGLVSFLDEIFDWMPSEWRTLFATAFIGGIIAHFFRR